MDIKIPRTYRLNPDLDSQLRKKAQEEKTTRSEIVRDALSNYLKKPKK
jgi:predicted transcriptional regulator